MASCFWLPHPEHISWTVLWAFSGHPSASLPPGSPPRAGIFAPALVTRTGVLQSSHPAALCGRVEAERKIHITRCGCISYCTHPHLLFPFCGASVTPCSIQLKGKGWHPAMCPCLGAASPAPGFGHILQSLRSVPSARPRPSWPRGCSCLLSAVPPLFSSLQLAPC